MRVLYGVAGCGLGHVMRARVILEHLRQKGHEVVVVTNGRPLELLRRSGHTCLELTGMHWRYVAGQVSRSSSVASWVKQAPGAVQQGLRLALGTVADFAPQAVLTDFELFSCVLGRLSGLPVVSFDHQHVIDRCSHPRTLRRQVKGFGLLRTACGLKTAGCSRYVVSSFYFPPQRQPRTTLVGPVLRTTVERSTARQGEHVLVYQTTPDDPRLLPALTASKVSFVVYGQQRDETVGNVQFRRFDENRYVEELASARAVITNGGFMGIGEALALGKPVLSVPVPHQPEQALNAAWLDALGWGQSASQLSADTVRDFLSREFVRPDEPRLRTGRHDACSAIDAALEGR
jgi:uncharacterized protein (TIGR00661 family)